MHNFIPNSATTAPSPLHPSTFAALGESADIFGLAVGSISPALSSPQYISALFTPCDGIPRQSAATNTFATKAALLGGVPTAFKQEATASSSWSFFTKTSTPDFTTSLELLTVWTLRNFSKQMPMPTPTAAAAAVCHGKPMRGYWNARHEQHLTTMWHYATMYLRYFKKHRFDEYQQIPTPLSYFQRFTPCNDMQYAMWMFIYFFVVLEHAKQLEKVHVCLSKCLSSNVSSCLEPERGQNWIRIWS